VLKIPSEDRRALVLLLSLEEESKTGLLAQLSNLNPALSTEDLADQLEDSLPGLNRRSLLEICRVIVVLYRVRSALEEKEDDFARNIWSSLDLVDREGVEKKGVTADVAVDFLKEILSCSSTIRLISKASDLLSFHEKVYLKSRIITDARPVYREDEPVTEAPIGTLLINMLNINYLDGDRKRKDVFFALEPRDLAELKGQIERAEKKNKSLEKTLEVANLKSFNPTRSRQDESSRD